MEKSRLFINRNSINFQIAAVELLDPQSPNCLALIPNTNHQFLQQSIVKYWLMV